MELKNQDWFKPTSMNAMEGYFLFENSRSSSRIVKRAMN
jgi:hypothetical protein